MSTTVTVIIQKYVSSYFSFWQSNFHDSKYTLVVNEIFVTYCVIINPIINPKMDFNPNLNPNMNPNYLSLFLQYLVF